MMTMSAGARSSSAHLTSDETQAVTTHMSAWTLTQLSGRGRPLAPRSRRGRRAERTLAARTGEGRVATLLGNDTYHETSTAPAQSRSALRHHRRYRGHRDQREPRRQHPGPAHHLAGRTRGQDRQRRIRRHPRRRRRDCPATPFLLLRPRGTARPPDCLSPMCGPAFSKRGCTHPVAARRAAVTRWLLGSTPNAECPCICSGCAAGTSRLASAPPAPTAEAPTYARQWTVRAAGDDPTHRRPSGRHA